MMKKVSQWVLATLVVILPFVAGCSSSSSGVPKQATIQGTVLLDGKPMPLGRIEFSNDKGYKATAVILEGKYSARAPVGDLKVAIQTSHLADPDFVASLRQSASSEGALVEAGSEEGKGEAKGDETAKKQLALLRKARPVAGKYEKAATSGLSAKLGEEGTTKEFKVTSK